MSLFIKIFGDESSKFIGNAKGIVDKINALEVDISKLVDEDFPKKTQEFKDRLEFKWTKASDRINLAKAFNKVKINPKR